MENSVAGTLETGKILRLLGAKKGRKVPKSTLRRIDYMTQDVNGLLQPRLDFRRMALASSDARGIVLADGTRFEGHKLAKSVGGAQEICCFLATIGPGIDLEIQRRMKAGRYADAYVLDAIGSIAAENVVEEFYQRTAGEAAEEGRGVTLRFSPGYCDWPLKQQRPLLSVVADGSPLAVTLSDSCLMSPRKSVSGLFGILPEGLAGADPAYNPCTICKKNDCLARRVH